MMITFLTVEYNIYGTDATIEIKLIHSNRANIDTGRIVCEIIWAYDNVLGYTLTKNLLSKILFR